MNEKPFLYTLNSAQNAFAEQNDFDYSQLITHREEKYRLHWCYMNPEARPCFNDTLVREMHHLYTRFHEKQNPYQIKYQVLASGTPHVFSFGGDLRMFGDLVARKDKDGLTQYAHTCAETMYAIATLNQLGITQICLVQGDALGGGLETALAADTLIAERGVKFGFPDVLFNSFPGIGAYTFLSRKVGNSITERIIMSGRLYSAEELYEMGVVDVLADNGKGEAAVYNYITKANRCENTIDSLRKIRNLHSPLKFDQLLEVATMWAENAMRLTAKDLRTIERLISKQTIVS
jgi:DSF synthase